jgi:hypothetical protein
MWRLLALATSIRHQAYSARTHQTGVAVLGETQAETAGTASGRGDGIGIVIRATSAACTIFARRSKPGSFSPYFKMIDRMSTAIMPCSTPGASK